MSEDSFPAAEVPERLADAGLAAWTFTDGAIRRAYATDGWPTTLMAVGQVGFLCEAAGHHADLEVSYAELVVKLTTHSAQGITAKDLALAARIEESVLWRPAGDSALDGPAGDFVAVD